MMFSLLCFVVLVLPAHATRPVGDVEVSLTMNATETDLDSGYNATLTCTVEGNPPPTKLKFSNVSSNIITWDSSTHSNDDNADDGITTSNYSTTYVHVYKVNPLQFGGTSTPSFTCTGENNNGTGVKSVSKDLMVDCTPDSTTDSPLEKVECRRVNWEASDPGYNKNLMQDFDNAAPNLKDGCSSTCVQVHSFTLNFSGLDACPGGFCRVNYLLLFEKNVAANLITISGTDTAGKYTSYQIDQLEVNYANNIIMPDNVLLQNLTLQFDGQQNVCEIIVAGTSIQDYNCTAGHFFNETSSQCQLCPRNTYNAALSQGNMECKACDFLRYSDEGSSTCVECSKETSLMNKTRCYENLGYNTNALGSVEGVDRVQYSYLTSYDPMKTAAVTLSEGTTELNLTDPLYVTSIVLISNDTGFAGRIANIPCKNSSLNYRPDVLVRTCRDYMVKSGQVKAIQIEVSKNVTINKLFVFGVAFAKAEAPPGYYNTNETFSKCKSGTFSKGGMVSRCTPCLVNQYQTKEGATECNNCESNHYSSSTGASLCNECFHTNDDKACKGLENCEEQSENNAIYGNYPYNWPIAFKGNVIKLPCQYNTDSTAEKNCTLIGDHLEYQKTDFSACKTKVTDEINAINNESVTADNSIEIATNIKYITESNSDVMNADNVVTTSQIIDNLVNISNDTLEPEVITNILQTVDNIHKDTEAQVLAQEDSASQMRKAVEKFSQKVQASKTGYIKASSVSVAVKRTTPGESTSFGIVGDSADLRNTSLNDPAKSTSSQQVLFAASVPYNKNGGDVTAILYDSDKFYPDSNMVEDVGSAFKKQFLGINPGKTTFSKIASMMVTEISYTNSTKKIEFQEDQKIELNFTVEEVTDPVVNYKMHYSSIYSCVFYDTENNKWDNLGCETSSINTKDGRKTVSCKCNHLTSFAILLSFSSDYRPIEETVSEVLLGLSLGCLIGTVVAYLPAKKLLKTRPVRLNLLLVTSLIFAIITFYFMDVVVDTSVQEEDTAEGEEMRKEKLEDINKSAPLECSVVAFLMNYFWLCQMAWMVTESVVMYKALVSSVLNSHISRYMLKFNLACWGIPAIFPIIGIVWGKTEFADPRTCFLQAPYGFVTFYGPMMVCVLFNIAIFIRIAWSGSISKNPNLLRRFKSAVTIMTLFGVYWVLGFLLIFKKVNNIWIRYTFILLNCTQGITLFILYAVLRDDLRIIWRGVLGMADPSKSTNSNITNSRSKGKTAMLTLDRTKGKTTTLTLDRTGIYSTDPLIPEPIPGPSHLPSNMHEDIAMDDCMTSKC